MGCVDNDADTFFRQDGMIKLKGRTNIAKEECDREEEATKEAGRRREEEQTQRRGG